MPKRVAHPETSPAPSLIDFAAAALRAESPVFTRRNLYFAVRRSQAGGVTELAFDATLRRVLSRGTVPGLLAEPSARRSPRLPKGWDAVAPRAVLLVDRPVVRDLLRATEAIAKAGVAVVCVDGTPSPVVAWLTRELDAGLRAPVLYLHDAATVLYPFTIEPLASLVRHRDGRPIVYRDLGLPPLGATARRFADPSLLGDEPILELEAIPPATLARYVEQAAFSS